MKLLVFSTLFPWPGVPHHGIFVLERLRHYLRSQGGEAVVIAPVPWVPRWLARGRFAIYKDVPWEEMREGIRVLHPRYPLIPKLNMHWAPLSVAWAGLRAWKRLRQEGHSFDLVDAHYLYPDSVAASFVAKRAGLPLVVTARGTDVNLIPRYRIPRRWLRYLLKRASSAITVCDALRQEMKPLHDSGFSVRVLSNGVDLEKFRPIEPGEARRRLGWPASSPVILSVGHLIERKGHHHVIRALRHLPGVQLKIVGGGEMDGELRRLAEEEQVADRVEFVGTLPHDELRVAYSAADVLNLLSSREGWPNVLLESMACGTPVVATKVWGSPEVVRDSSVGLLVEDPNPEAVAQSVQELLDRPRDRRAVRQYAEQHSWDRTTRGMHEVFCAATGEPLPVAAPQAVAPVEAQKSS